MEIIKPNNQDKLVDKHLKQCLRLVKLSSFYLTC